MSGLFVDGVGGDGVLRVPFGRVDHEGLGTFDARKGSWIKRKLGWRGVIPEVRGRGEGLLGGSLAHSDPGYFTLKAKAEAIHGKMTNEEFVADHYPRDERRDDDQWGTSRFDPCLAEVLLHLYTAPGDLVIDPWHGGVERGVVSAVMGRKYLGMDIRREQGDSNREAVEGVGYDGGYVKWVCGDSSRAGAWGALSVDFAFGCPPYWHLEKYGGGDADISMMSLAGWERGIEGALRGVYGALRADAFAAFVIGDCRHLNGKEGVKGSCAGLPTRFVAAAERVGFGVVNDSVYLSPVGRRAALGVSSFRKTGTLARMHEMVYTLVKGSQREAFSRVRGCHAG